MFFYGEMYLAGKIRKSIVCVVPDGSVIKLNSKHMDISPDMTLFMVAHGGSARDASSVLGANDDPFSQHELDELMVDYLSSQHRVSHRNKLSRNPPTGWGKWMV